MSGSNHDAIDVETRPYDMGDEINDVLMRYEDAIAKIRMYFERGFYEVYPTRRTKIEHAAAAMRRAGKVYTALTSILKPTLEGWKKR